MPGMEETIAAVRTFNRFYTQFVGALDVRFLGSALSLAEARLLFEIATGDMPVAADLQAALVMDAGYVSRVLRRFETEGWIRRETGTEDARRRPIALTSAGRKIFEGIDGRQRAEIATMLEPLSAMQRGDLARALGAARTMLDPLQRSAITIRTFRTGDMGLIAARQSILYAAMHGWGRELEIIEGDVTTTFLRNFKPGREQCWVAEVEGVMAGSIFLTDEGGGLARLRLLYVEPFARGLGIGTILVRTCVAFAREVGFEAITLWTHTILESARRLYAANGFEIIETSMHEEFGEPVQGETWRLALEPDEAIQTRM